MPNKRTRYIQIKVTEDEMKHVKFVAGRKGQSVSGLLRLAFLEYAERQGLTLIEKKSERQ
jgi:hypothetical protein